MLDFAFMEAILDQPWKIYIFNNFFVMY